MPRLLPCARSWAQLLGPPASHTSTQAWGRLTGRSGLPDLGGRPSQGRGKAQWTASTPIPLSLGTRDREPGPPGTHPPGRGAGAGESAWALVSDLDFSLGSQHPTNCATLGQHALNLCVLKDLTASMLASLQPSPTQQSHPPNSLGHIQACPERSDAPHLRAKNDSLAITCKSLHDLSVSSPKPDLLDSFLLFLETARHGPALGPLSQGKTVRSDTPIHLSSLSSPRADRIFCLEAHRDHSNPLLLLSAIS